MANDPPHVLVVDDEVRLQRTLVRSVNELGFPATAVGSAEQALVVLQEETISIALVDLNLPGMEGQPLLETMAGLNSTVVPIVLTGFGDLAAAQAAIRFGAVDFLTKPCRLGELERALDRARRRLKRFGVDQTDASLPPEPVPVTLKELERQHILKTLAHFEGDRDATAKALGISRRTLYYRLARYREQDSE